jgi:endoglycosylceramidase
MLTEFGASDDVGYLQDMVARADRFMVPWLEWAYCGCGDPTTTGPGTKQAIVVDPSKPPRGSNVVHSTLRALVEPYPQVVAGTPHSWSFDRASGTFKLSFSTQRTSGRGRFAAGSVSEIAAPALVYGGRYSVRVRGAKVISARRSTVLRIASLRGAANVSVTVTRR